MGTSKRKRATNEEMQERLDQVILYLRQGYQASRVRRLLLEQYPISARTADRLIQKAWDLFATLGKTSSEVERGVLFSRLHYLYSETSAGGHKNLDQAIQLLKLQAQLLPKSIVKGTADALPLLPITKNDLSPELEKTWNTLLLEDTME